MEELNYFNLLRKIDNILKLLPTKKTLDRDDLDEIDTISSRVTKNLGSIMKEMSFQRQSMFLVTLLNTLVRICAIDESGMILSRQEFQTMIDTLLNYIWHIFWKQTDNYHECLSDMLDSILMNLGKGGLIQTCFNRLLSHTTKSTTGKFFLMINNELGTRNRLFKNDMRKSRMFVPKLTF